MTDYMPGPVRRIAVEGGGELIVSSPIPLHYCLVKSVRGAVKVRLISTPDVCVPSFYDSLGQARQAASRIVNERVRVDMMTKFSGPQRYAMGQQKCPYAMYGKLCNEPATGFSVWCDYHPKGRTREDL